MCDTGVHAFGLVVSPDAHYLHFKEDRRYDNVLEAEKFIKLCRKAAEVLAERFPVYIRRMPEFYPDNEFVSSKPSWKAIARYSIADFGEPGLYHYYGGEWTRGDV